MSEPPSQGIALVLAYLFGIFGADKFYVGLTGQGIAMVVLTCTIIGLFATIPWAYLSCLFLVIGILWNGKPMLYPDNIKWAPLTDTDRTIAWIVIAISVIGIIAGFFIGTRREGFQYKKEIEDEDEEKN
jgi:TM2 domain-containing membrane protein YozV